MSSCYHDLEYHGNIINHSHDSLLCEKPDNVVPRFINTFIETAADYRERVHIQSDLEDAGFELGQLKRLVSKFGNQSELLQQELAIWDRSYIEVCSGRP